MFLLGECLLLLRLLAPSCFVLNPTTDKSRNFVAVGLQKHQVAVAVCGILLQETTVHLKAGLFHEVKCGNVIRRMGARLGREEHMPHLLEIVQFSYTCRAGWLSDGMDEMEAVWCGIAVLQYHVLLRVDVLIQSKIQRWRAIVKITREPRRWIICQRDTGQPKLEALFVVVCVCRVLSLPTDRIIGNAVEGGTGRLDCHNSANEIGGNICCKPSHYCAGALANENCFASNLQQPL